MTRPLHQDVPLDLGQSTPALAVPQASRRSPGARRDQAPRWALVQRVRREIARGTYETREKWEEVVTRLLARNVL